MHIVQFRMEIRKIRCLSSAFRRQPRTWSFYVAVLQRTAKKCTKIYNAREQLLFCSLNLLFSDIRLTVVIVVCLNSLISFQKQSFLTTFEIYFLVFPWELVVLFQATLYIKL